MSDSIVENRRYALKKKLQRYLDTKYPGMQHDVWFSGGIGEYEFRLRVDTLLPKTDELRKELESFILVEVYFKDARIKKR